MLCSFASRELLRAVTIRAYYDSRLMARSCRTTGEGAECQNDALVYPHGSAREGNPLALSSNFSFNY